MTTDEGPPGPRLESTLWELARSVVEATTLDGLLAATGGVLLDGLGASRVAVVLGRVPTGELAVRHVTPPEPLPAGGGPLTALAGRVVGSGETLVVRPEDWDARFPEGGPAVAGVTWIGVPVGSEGTRLGALVVARSREETVEAGELSLLRLAGGLVGQALHRFRTEDDLRADLAFKSALMQALSDARQAILVLGSRGLLFANEAATALTGFDRDQLSRFASLLDLVPANERPRVAAALADEEPPPFATAIRHADGKRRNVLLALRRLSLPEGAALLATFDDLAPALGATRTDPVTALPTRAALADTAEREWRRAQHILHADEKPVGPKLREPGSLTLLLVEVHGIATVTGGPDDTEGALQHAAAAMRTCLRTSDFVGRLEGNQFFALLPDTGVEGAKVTAERLRSAVEEAGPPLGAPEGATLMLWIGSASTSQPGEASYEELLERAEEALASVFRAGGPSEPTR